MLYIKGTEIQLTRGDTAYLEVPLVTLRHIDGQDEPIKEPFEMQHDDILILTVRTDVKNPDICFQKVVQGSNMFHIEPNDTCHCEFSKYKYDVQLTTARGDVLTVIEPACFKILAEVTY